MANKVERFMTVVNAIRKSPLPEDVLDMAKTFLHTDKRPAHEALVTAYKLAGKEIPSVHKLAIDELAKGHKITPANYKFYTEGRTINDRPAPMVDSGSLADNIRSSLTSEAGNIQYWDKLKGVLRNPQGEYMVSPEYLDATRKSLPKLGRNSNFLDVLNALNLGF